MGNKQEEKEFYKKLGSFIKIMESKSKLDDVINNIPKNERIKGFISSEMLCNYKKGVTRISLYKLLKLSELYNYTPGQFIEEFIKHMIPAIKSKVNFVNQEHPYTAETKIEGGELTDRQFLHMNGCTRETFRNNFLNHKDIKK